MTLLPVLGSREKRHIRAARQVQLCLSVQLSVGQVGAGSGEVALPLDADGKGDLATDGGKLFRGDARWRGT